MKLMISIPDEAYELLKNKPELDNIAESIIANGTPISTEGGLISRSELKKVIETYRPILITSDYLQGKNNMIDYCIAEIEGAPIVEPERPQGEWIVDEDNGILKYMKCPNCGKVAEWLDGGRQLLSNFCPNCGADLRGEDE